MSHAQREAEACLVEELTAAKQAAAEYDQSRTTGSSIGPEEAANEVPSERTSEFVLVVANSSTTDNEQQHVDCASLAVLCSVGLLALLIILAPPVVVGLSEPGSSAARLSVIASRSLLINACLFVGELVSIASFHEVGMARLASRVGSLSDIAMGPVLVISFYQTDFMGTALFFLALWHFLCDSSETRPTYILIMPWRTQAWSSSPTACLVTWLMAWWVNLHHIGVGMYKIARDDQMFSPGELSSAADQTTALVLEQTAALLVYGAGITHLSYAIQHFGIPGGDIVRAVGVLTRLGGSVATFAIATAHPLAGIEILRAFAALDAIWLTGFVGCHLVLTQLIPLLTQHPRAASPSATSSQSQTTDGQFDLASPTSGSTSSNVRLEFDRQLCRQRWGATKNLILDSTP